MSRQGFYAESLGRVMAAEEEIDPKFFRGHGGPMRRFAGDEGIDAFPGNGVNFGAGASGDQADRFAFAPVPRANSFTGPPNEFSSLRASSAREICAFTLSPTHCPFCSKNGSVFSKPSALASCALLPRTEWISRGRCGAVESQVVLESAFQHPPPATGDRLQSRPEQAVVHDEKIYPALDGRVDRPRGGIDRGADLGDRAGIFDLQPVQRIWPILDLAEREGDRGNNPPTGTRLPSRQFYSTRGGLNRGDRDPRK